MNLYCITLEESHLKDRIDILDFLTTPETGKGVNHEKYWLISTDIQVRSPENDYTTRLINNLFQRAQENGYDTLMIKKEIPCSPSTSPEEPSETNS